ncbi:hypothetical protein AO391_06290 [Pseudomonas marginalis ICMP 9505]|nr:hypothetical protein AO391_06290 [Pseudomonas marginalis ICMP 9505]
MEVTSAHFRQHLAFYQRAHRNLYVSLGKAGLQRLSNIRVRRLIEHIQFYLRAFGDTTGLQGSLG